MERGRESRRNSLLAPRRPRSVGIRETSGNEDGDDLMDDVPNPRQRERSKKENSSFATIQGILSSSLGPSSRSKRKRQGCQENQDQFRNTFADYSEETAEEMEIGFSDEGDDPPPIQRRALKVRQGKPLEDGLCAETPAVPRKARTALLKRPQEPASPYVLDVSTPQLPTASGRAIPAANAPSPSSFVSLTPDRRLGKVIPLVFLQRPITAKPRVRKASEVSEYAPVSKTEVEVAEALFDLARSCTKQPMAVLRDAFVNAKPEINKLGFCADSDDKFEPVNHPNGEASPCMHLQASPPSKPVSSSTPSRVPQSSVQLSSSSCRYGMWESAMICPAMATAASGTMVPSRRPPDSLPAVIVGPPAEAPKRKRPRLRAGADEVGSVSHMTTPVDGTHSSSGPTSISSGELVTGIACTPHFLVELEISGRPLSADLENSLTMPPLTAPCPINLPRAVERPFSCLPALVHRSISLEDKILPSGMGNCKVDVNRDPQDAMAVGQDWCKDATSYDLQVPSIPNSTLVTVNEENSGPSNGDNISQLDGETEVKDEKQAHPLEMQGEDDPGRECRREKKESEVKRPRESGQEHKKERFIEKGENISMGMALSAKRPFSETQKALILGSRVQEEKAPSANPAVSSHSTPALPCSTTVLTSVANNMTMLPVSFGMAGWHLGLPPIGYYSPGAASSSCWQVARSLDGSAPVDRHASPTLQLPTPCVFHQACQPPDWKRCALHVDIAHFIDTQQQMNRHSYIQTANQTSASLYGVEPYSMSIPFTSKEALFGGDLAPSHSAADSANGTSGNGTQPILASVPGNNRNVLATSIMTSAKEGDKARFGPGFPVSQAKLAGSGTATCGIGRDLLGIRGSGSGLDPNNLSSGSAMGLTLVTGPGVGARTGDVGNRYLQAVLQRSGVSSPFQVAAPSRPGFSSSSHQQAAQYFSSPFYATHVVHPPTHAQQQVQRSATVSIGMVPSHGNQVAHSFPHSTSQQSRSVLLSSYPTNASLQQGQRTVYKEGEDVADSNYATVNRMFLRRADALFGGITEAECSLQQELNCITQFQREPVIEQQPSQPVVRQQSAALFREYQDTRHAARQRHSSTDLFVETFSGMPSATANQIASIVIGTSCPATPIEASQGYAKLQDMSDSITDLELNDQPRQLLSVASQPQEVSVTYIQEIHRTGQMQKGATNSGSEDGKTVVGEISLLGRCGMDIAQVSQSPNHQALGSTLNLSRIDLSDSTTSQEISGDGLCAHRKAANVGQMLSLRSSTPGTLKSGPSGQLTGNTVEPRPSLSIGTNPSQTVPQIKFLDDALATSTVVLTPSQISPYPDRQAESLLGRDIQLPTTLLRGENVLQLTQASQQDPVLQQSVYRELSRNSLRSSTCPSIPVPETVVEAVKAKDQLENFQPNSKSEIQSTASTSPTTSLSSSKFGVLPTSDSTMFPVPISESVSSESKSMRKKESCCLSCTSFSDPTNFKRSTLPLGADNVTISGSPLVQYSSMKSSIKQDHTLHPGHSQLSHQTPKPFQSSLLMTPTQYQKYHQQSETCPQESQHVHKRPTSIEQSHHRHRQIVLQNASLQQPQLDTGSYVCSHVQLHADETGKEYASEMHMKSSMSSFSRTPSNRQALSGRLETLTTLDLGKALDDRVPGRKGCEVSRSPKRWISPVLPVPPSSRCKLDSFIAKSNCGEEPGSGSAGKPLISVSSSVFISQAGVENELLPVSLANDPRSDQPVQTSQTSSVVLS